MFENYSNLLAIIDTVGEMKGRIKLQKIAYVAKFLNLGPDETFKFSDFGPTSEQIDCKISEMKNLRFLEQNKLQTGLFPHYQYKLTDLGKQILQEYPAEKFIRLKKLTSELRKYRSEDLELITAILFLKDQNYTREEIEKKLVLLKPKFGKEKIKKSFEDIEKLLSEYLKTQE